MCTPTPTSITSHNSSRCSRSDQVQTLLYDRFDCGSFGTCLAIRRDTRTLNDWYCPECILPGKEIQVQMSRNIYQSKYDEVRVTRYPEIQFGLPKIPYTSSTNIDRLDLRRHR